MRPALIAFGFALFATPTIAMASDAAPAATAATAAEPTVVDKTAPDYMLCKRIAITGSRARKERVCKTNAEWARLSRQGQDLARDTVDRSTSIYRDPSM